MNKIKYVSFLCKIIFQISFVTALAVQIVGWIYSPLQSGLLHVIPDFYLPYMTTPITIDMRVLGFLVTLIPVVFELAVFWNLSCLFGYYQRHQIFTAPAVRCIRNAGYALLVYQILQPITEFILGFVLTAKNPPGFRIAKVIFSDGDAKVMLAALIIILISWVMTEGSKMHEEQQLTI